MSADAILNRIYDVWNDAGDEERFVESRIRPSPERLPNGNTLIAEADGGRILEVTPDREIVWEFMKPVRGGEAGGLVPVVPWGRRIDPGSPDLGLPAS